jgi:PBP1b-binding outer membrane lipoprotein LpoB
MKKTILAVAFMAVVMVSCQDKTKDKVEDATQEVGTEMEQKTDTVTEKTESVIDTAKVKAGEALEKAGEEAKEAGEKLKEAAKK